MSSQVPVIEFFKDVAEELSSVSLRRNKNTGVRNILLIFEKLRALDRFNSFTKGSVKNLSLIDSEGKILVTPHSLKMIFGGDEGHELKRVECIFEIESDAELERFSRFMDRYAEANEMEFGSK